MTTGSLKKRLFTVGVLTLLGALALAALGLTWLFERHLERRAVQEADLSLTQLIAGAGFSPAGQLTLNSLPTDPRFDEAYSGYYWQVASDGKTAERSRSLWDFSLSLPADILASSEKHVHPLVGPKQSKLIAVERAITLTLNGRPVLVRLAVALDAKDIVAARNEFSVDLIMALLLLGAFIATAFLLQVGIGLRPLSAMKAHLSDVRSGAMPRLLQSYPQEVSPLADEINLLLDERDLALDKARRRAADLAHGLKTPLTALNADLRRLRQSGQTEAAEQIATLSAMMERHISRELTRARIAGKASLVKPQALRPLAEAIAAVLVRTPQAEGKGFDFDIDPACLVAMDRADLEEVLGNLMENAVRYARSVVRLAANETPEGLRLCVEDDGRGLDQAQHEQLLQRGIRLDESGNAGLGLSIVQDVIEAYGGSVHLGKETLGGLAVTLIIPTGKNSYGSS